MSRRGAGWDQPWAADFLTKPAAFVYESYCRKIPRDSLLGKEDKRKTRKAVLSVLGRIHCTREDGECEILCRVDEKSGTAHPHRAQAL